LIIHTLNHRTHIISYIYVYHPRLGPPVVAHRFSSLNECLRPYEYVENREFLVFQNESREKRVARSVYAIVPRTRTRRLERCVRQRYVLCSRTGPRRSVRHTVTCARLCGGRAPWSGGQVRSRARTPFPRAGSSLARRTMSARRDQQVCASPYLPTGRGARSNGRPKAARVYLLTPGGTHAIRHDVTRV